MESGALETQTAYGKAKLAGEPEPLDLPSDRARPATVSFRGGRCSRPLDPRLMAALEARAHEEGASLFIILLAAFKTLLHRYTGRDDVIVGVPIANRQRAEVEGLIGFFANTGQEYELPGTPAEVALACIWEEVLTLKKIGIHENFFDLGGHSLLATQVVSRIRREFDPLINAIVLRDRAGSKMDLSANPTLTFSPAVMRHPLVAHGISFKSTALGRPPGNRAIRSGEWASRKRLSPACRRCIVGRSCDIPQLKT